MKIVVGMSGGVDSSLSAALLAEQGHQVLGVFMENWTDDSALTGCATWPQDRRDALNVAKALGVPFQVVNFEREYQERVVEYFYREYDVGRTPNPDIVCNREIKFGILLDWALEHGYEYVATGHYARVEHGAHRSRLLKGIDGNKDQTYFLSQLSQHQLRHALFPIGELAKPEVRAEATKRGLLTADKPDSQGLCFVGEINLTEFLQQRLPAKAGIVLTSAGEEVGEHEGAVYYTVGQRKGLGVARGVPMYVVDTDVAANTVTIRYDHELFQESFVTEQPHWVASEAPRELRRTGGARFEVSIRYRMQPVPAKVTLQEDGSLRVQFDEAQRGPTPGQYAVFYDGDELLGSAVIS